MVRLSVLNDAVIRGKKEVVIKPASNLVLNFLAVMQKHGYVEKFERHGGHTPGNITVEITGKLKKCVMISQRYDTSVRRLDGWIRQILPSPQVGYLVISTSKGVMDHREAREKNVGGRVLGYFL